MRRAQTTTQADDRTRMRQLDNQPQAIWGRSLAAGAVCVGTGAVLALLAIFGPPR